MNNGFLTNSLRGIALLGALLFFIPVQAVRAQGTAPIAYDVLKREQRALLNVLTDGETDLASGRTRLLNNSLRLSAGDVARAGSKVAHLRAMAQLHPERCARTTGAFLLPASSAQSSLTNNFFANIKPRIVKLEDDLDTYLTQLERLDPKLAKELRSLLEAYNDAARNALNGGSTDVIEYDPKALNDGARKILRDQNALLNTIDPNGTGAGGGPTEANGGGGAGGNNANPGAAAGGGGGNNANGGGGGASTGADMANPSSIRGSIRDTGGQILSAANFLDANTYVNTTKSDNGILTREEKITGKLAPDGSGGAVFHTKDSKIIDWQFDIEGSDTGFTLVDRSTGAADEDKGFTVQSWTVKDPSGRSQDFPGSVQLKYNMSVSGKYVITAKVQTKLNTSFTIYISPMNN